MATRSLTNVEALPTLEPLELEHSEEVALRRLHGLGSWARGALLLDAVMLVAAAVGRAVRRGRCGHRADRAGLARRLRRRSSCCSCASAACTPGVCSVSALDDVRKVVAATALASMTVLALRILLPGGVDDLASQSLRLLAFSAVYVGAGASRSTGPSSRRAATATSAKPTLIVGAGRIGRLAATRLLDHTRARSEARRLHRQGAARRDRPARSGAGSQLGSRAADRAARGRARGDHLLDRAERGAAAGSPALRGARRPRLARPAAVRARHRAAHRRAPRRAAAALAQRHRPEGVAFRGQVPGRPLRRRAAPVAASARAGGRGARDTTLGWLARSSSGSVASAATAASSRCSSSARCAGAIRRRGRLGLGPGAARATRLQASVDRATTGATRFGRFLRALSIDELPQLFNVLDGRHVADGPAPRAHPLRPAVRGRTSTATTTATASSPGSPAGRRCNGLRGKTSLSDRVEWDNYYIENWSLWLDFKILLMTVWAVRTLLQPDRIPRAAPIPRLRWSLGGIPREFASRQADLGPEQECGCRPTVRRKNV